MPARPSSSTRAATGRSTARPGSPNRSTSPGAAASSSSRSTPASRSCPWSRSAARRRRSSSPTASGSRSSCASTSSCRLKTLPVSLSLPWLVNVGDFLGHLPLPAKITVQVMDPIDLPRALRPRPRPRRGLRGRHVARCRISSPSSPPSAGCRSSGERPMRIEQKVTVDAPRHLGLGLRHRARQLPGLHGGPDPLGGRRGAPQRPRRPLSHAAPRRRRRRRRPDRDRRVAARGRHGLELGHRRRPAGTLAASRARRRPHARHLPLRLRSRRRRHLGVDRRAGRGARSEPPLPAVPARPESGPSRPQPDSAPVA